MLNHEHTPFNEKNGNDGLHISKDLSKTKGKNSGLYSKILNNVLCDLELQLDNVSCCSQVIYRLLRLVFHSS